MAFPVWGIRVPECPLNLLLPNRDTAVVHAAKIPAIR